MLVSAECKLEVMVNPDSLLVFNFLETIRQMKPMKKPVFYVMEEEYSLTEICKVIN